MDGALTTQPSTRLVPPARKASASSMHRRVQHGPGTGPGPGHQAVVEGNLFRCGRFRGHLFTPSYGGFTACLLAFVVAHLAGAMVERSLDWCA